MLGPAEAEMFLPVFYCLAIDKCLEKYTVEIKNKMIDSAIARIFIEKWNKSSSKKKKRKINPHHFIAVHLTTNKIPKHIIPFDQQDYRILFNSVRHVKEKHLETFFFSKVRIKKNKITWSKECIICCTIKDRMVFKNYDIFHWRKPYKKAKNDHFKIFGFVT